MQKNLITLLCLCFLCGCKKDQTEKTINIQVTDINSTTTFTFQLQNAQGGSPDFELQNSNTNGNYSTTAIGGQKLNLLAWTFLTQQEQYGQGKITVTEGSQTLLTINGGYGSNTVTVP